MSYGPNRRYKPGRGGSLGLSRSSLSRLVETLSRTDVLVRLCLAFAAALILWAITGGWAPPSSFRTGYVPRRDIIARVDFSVDNIKKTDELKRQSRQQAEWVYENNLRPLEEKRQELANKMSLLSQSETIDMVDPTVWREFNPPPPPDTPATDDAPKLAAIRAFFSSGMDSGKFDEALKRALLPLERSGLLNTLAHTSDQGPQGYILIRPSGEPKWSHRASIDEVQISKVKPGLKQRLLDEMQSQGGMNTNSEIVAQLTYNWLESRLPSTLSPDPVATNDEQVRAEAEVAMVSDSYRKGESELAPGGLPLGPTQMELLRHEYVAWLQEMSISRRISHSASLFGMYTALAVLCGFYIYHRKRRVLTDLRQYITLLASVITTVWLCWICAADQWRVEIIPLLLFGMTAAIAYEKELALLLSASVSLIVAFSLEQGLAEFVILVSSVAAAILLLRRIRSRTKLIYVGAFTGAVVMLTTIGVGTLAGQAFGAANIAMAFSTPEAADLVGSSLLPSLMVGAAWCGFCALLAGLLMTGLLPFIERLFDVQTDISLLELGDVQHPLLQELVRRAPGTYNHSINVASIAETAAEAIHANGLLVRVGAYFHDIGKMLKPSYFVENQGSEGNRHESLQPAMSTLVIIAHVKDGADLARQHHLPQSIIDFIEQHHGTTLVEYFFRREAKRLESDPDGGELDESTFRYPGPKPQTKEAAVLMISDVVESASRALTDPTPSRIESLVHDLAMKRLLDGQFDECGLTLQELRVLEDSLVKSLTAVYHGRVKYPEHQTV